MRLARAPLLLAATIVAACAPGRAERPVEVVLPSASASQPPDPPAASSVAVTPPSAPAPPADGQWKRRCATFVQEGLTAAAALDPALRAAVVRTGDRDEVSVSNPLGFFLHVHRNVPDSVTRDPPGVWQQRAESLQGSYHVLFLKDAGGVSAGLSFDGWPSPRVQPLVAILHAAIDHCFPPRSSGP